MNEWTISRITVSLADNTVFTSGLEECREVVGSCRYNNLVKCDEWHISCQTPFALQCYNYDTIPNYRTGERSKEFPSFIRLILMT